MDPLGIAGSVLAIAGAGIKLSLSLYDFAQALGSAGKDIQLIANELGLFGQTLRLVHNSLDEVFKTFGGRQSRILIEAAEIVPGLTKQSEAVVKEARELMESIRRDRDETSWTARLRKPFGKVRWLFQKSRADVVQKLVLSLKGTVCCLLSVISVEVARAKNQDQAIINQLEAEKQALVNLMKTQKKKFEQALKDTETNNKEARKTMQSVPNVGSQDWRNAPLIAYSPPRVLLDTAAADAVLQLALTTRSPDVSYQPSTLDEVEQMPEQPVSTARTRTPLPRHRESQATATTPERLFECALGCGQKFKRKDMRQHLEVHTLARAVYAFRTMNPSMISFDAGDILTDVRDPDEKWFEALDLEISNDWQYSTINSQSGGFPRNRIRPLIRNPDYEADRGKVMDQTRPSKNWNLNPENIDFDDMKFVWLPKQEEETS